MAERKLNAEFYVTFEPARYTREGRVWAIQAGKLTQRAPRHPDGPVVKFVASLPRELFAGLAATVDVDVDADMTISVEQQDAVST